MAGVLLGSSPLRWQELFRPSSSFFLHREAFRRLSNFVALSRLRPVQESALSRSLFLCVSCVVCEIVKSTGSHGPTMQPKENELDYLGEYFFKKDMPSSPWSWFQPRYDASCVHALFATQGT